MAEHTLSPFKRTIVGVQFMFCLLYTSDAADE